jgi:16S rRNA (adenine1518-N6/adenine1519-N6)-dimethyltransferase
MNPTPPKKSLGQHWLTDQPSLAAMCAAAEVNPSDTVLEIGPGHGSLTEVLLARAAQVVAIEKDETLAKNLLHYKNLHLEDSPLNSKKDGMVGNLTVVAGDILRFDFSQLPSGYKLVANIPYYLTSNLLRVLSEASNPPSQMALLVQKEVAERVAAAPGAMSLLSVTTQAYWRVSLCRLVPAELFSPPPKVDSQILALTRRPASELLENGEQRAFFQIVKAGFAARRKTLLNNLSAGYHLAKPEVNRWLAAAGVDASYRAQSLSLADWYKLYASAREAKIKLN